MGDSSSTSPWKGAPVFMRIPGEWRRGDDGVYRPLVPGEIVTASGDPLQVPFLLDTGADRTVLSAAVLAAAGLSRITSADKLLGIGVFPAEISPICSP